MKNSKNYPQNHFFEEISKKYEDMQKKLFTKLKIDKRLARPWTNAHTHPVGYTLSTNIHSNFRDRYINRLYTSIQFASKSIQIPAKI